MCCYSSCNAWGAAHDERRTQFDRSLTERLTHLSDKKVIVLGDLNVAPTDGDVLKLPDMDMADISSYKLSEYSAFSKNLRSDDLRDVYQFLHPNISDNDWTWSRKNRHLSMCIVHAMCSYIFSQCDVKGAAISVCDIVENCFGRDHRPLVLRLRQPDVAPMHDTAHHQDCKKE
jgi:exonuclease III